MIVETRFRWAAYFGAIACVITRAPTLMADGKVFELPLAINVGYVVFFGPLVILIFYIDSFRSIKLANTIKDNWSDVTFKIIVYAPAIQAAFLSLQYFLEVRPGPTCDPQNWSALIGWEGFAAVYCFGSVDQSGVPWVMEPPWAFALAQVAMPIACIVLAYRSIQLVRKAKEEREDTPPDKVV